MSAFKMRESRTAEGISVYRHDRPHPREGGQRPVWLFDSYEPKTESKLSAISTFRGTKKIKKNSGAGSSYA
jgi:hypothetical protein